jgi:hypothetical protein
VSDGCELLKVDIELPEYTAKLMQFRRAAADDPDLMGQGSEESLGGCLR